MSFCPTSRPRLRGELGLPCAAPRRHRSAAAGLRLSCFIDTCQGRGLPGPLFVPAGRAVLRRAGIILVTQAISGDVADEPVVIAHLHSALEDARMLAVFLQEISEKAQDGFDTHSAENLATLAGVWSGHVAAALLDRLLHRCHVLNIRGRLYRLRDLERMLR